MKRIDLLEATKLLAKKKIGESNGTLMIATSYCEGWRTGDITMSWEAWLEEDIDTDEVEETEAASADPTPDPEEGSEPTSMTRWRDSSTTSPDSAPAITGT